MTSVDREELAVDLLVDTIWRCYGYDFRHYARASLKRRLRHCAAVAEVSSIAHLIPTILHDADAFGVLLSNLSVNVTEMFRDPGFYRELRDAVFPVLTTYPFVKIWHAGCATGEEVYSLAILLLEADLLGRCQIYATDLDPAALDVARAGIYPVARIEGASEKYREAGGQRSFADYCHVGYDAAIVGEPLKRHVTFAQHNLATDGAFGEMNLIVCRNVLIYFDQVLQDRVLSLFCSSLVHRGFVCLGTKETIDFSSTRPAFDLVSDAYRIYRGGR